ncbi:DUF368 domain-containing protein [uncultured Cetobacterium sp.]|uniref:DUF368 domain-containing protein n=1 Tax=uncultured Cetobacterium sp. TaxID=527638 RepID=UPI0025F11EB9|nr:DUF368 domain-containing protein [uncultured Cetobacterium sp.]
MVKNFLKGIVIGIANVLPGVSGGTLAVVLGIYDKLTEAVGNFLTASMEKKIEYAKFLAQIGAGAVLGIVAFAGIISKMYELYPKGTTVAFLFLILPSIPVILKGEKFFKKENLIAFFSGVAFTGIFMFLTKTLAGEEIVRTAQTAFTAGYGVKLFFCGIVAAGAMVIPGISGSLLLILLGEYYNVLGYIKSFAILPLIFFAAGTGIGLVLVAKGINILLNKYRSYTLNFIVGIIVVSLIEIIQTLFI